MENKTYIVFSLFIPSIFRPPSWIHHPRIWPLLQLPHHQIPCWRRFLPFPQLVRWPSLVSPGPNHWRNYLPWSDVDLDHYFQHIKLLQCDRECQRCLCLFGSFLFIIDLSDHLQTDLGSVFDWCRFGLGCIDCHCAWIHIEVSIKFYNCFASSKPKLSRFHLLFDLYEGQNIFVFMTFYLILKANFLWPLLQSYMK